jgi:hypothetical protein
MDEDVTHVLEFVFHLISPWPPTVRRLAASSRRLALDAVRAVRVPPVSSEWLRQFEVDAGKRADQ